MMKNGMYPRAVAEIRGGAECPQLRGTVRFFQRRDGVVVEAMLQGLPRNDNGFFGFHIHEGDSCLGEGFRETGGHYNPFEMMHPRHAGDLPPLLSDHGKAYMRVFTDRFHAGEIIGRSVIVHSSPDDLTSQPSGNSGTKIACGVIRRA